ncbi:MAG TPA: hypothetical protein VIL37_16490 [Natronosporangium sp.]
MSAGWVAGGVRARAIARRRLGTGGARELARVGSLAEAVAILAESPYGRGVTAGTDLAGAQRAVAATLLWHLRVLAGWLPGAGVGMLRSLAGWFEIANVDEHLQALADRPSEPPFSLGALATSWPRLAATRSTAELRATLAASPWGDPGGETDREIRLGMRMAWADRVATRVSAARGWATGAAALLVAKERFALGRPLPERTAVVARRLLGHQATTATTLAELAAAVPPEGRWALAGIDDPARLWEAELRWWRRLREDGDRLLGAATFGPDRIAGAVALLAADAWLVRAALAAAAHGGSQAVEVFDAVG